MPKGVYERTPEHCAIISAAKMGHEVSDKTRVAISDTLKGRTLTPEHCTAISAATTGENNPMYGKRHTPETIAKILETMRNSDDIKIAIENMIGGEDIVKHHFIYDHNNPDQHTIEITRAKHTAHHWWMRRNGLKVPHYNNKR